MGESLITTTDSSGAEKWQILSPVHADVWGCDDLNRSIKTTGRGRALRNAREYHAAYGPQEILKHDKIILLKNSERNGPSTDIQFLTDFGVEHPKPRLFASMATGAQFTKQWCVPLFWILKKFRTNKLPQLFIGQGNTVKIHDFTLHFAKFEHFCLRKRGIRVKAFLSMHSLRIADAIEAGRIALWTGTGSPTMCALSPYCIAAATIR